MRGTPGFMAPEKLGINSEDTDGVDEVDPFPADMVKPPLHPARLLTFLSRENSSNISFGLEHMS